MDVAGSTNERCRSHSVFNLPMGEVEEGGGMARTHGRPSTYNNGKCRCEACKAAIADYRAGRRAAGLDLAPTRREPATAGSVASKGSTA